MTDPRIVWRRLFVALLTFALASACTTTGGDSTSDPRAIVDTPYLGTTVPGRLDGAGRLEITTECVILETETGPLTLAWYDEGTRRDADSGQVTFLGNQTPTPVTTGDQVVISGARLTAAQGAAREWLVPPADSCPADILLVAGFSVRPEQA